ncbi:hypothetical protein H009_15763 [Agrobacterium tumefaciens str. Cherry 2E-2-2]|nr:hypothetical protein H009_15763 [Agrobacterium tumefaciens str. Cherry 2E-2-2]
MLRKFRNHSEDRLQQQMRPAIERHGAELHEKVRVADVIDIKELKNFRLGTYALQSHFDFVLIDEDHMPVVAIEFDGPGHTTANDELKNSICRQANLPLIRIHSFEEVREVNQMTLARYLVELVFYGKAFLQMQADGQIPMDEPFTLSAFLKEDAKHIFDSEFDFISSGRSKLIKTLRQYGLSESATPHFSISHLTLRSPTDHLHSFFSVNSNKGPIVGTAALKVTLPSPGFLDDLGFASIEIAQFVEGMAFDNLLENIRLIATGAGHVVTHSDERLQELKRLGEQDYTLVMGGGGSSADANLMAAFASGNGGQLI